MRHMLACAIGVLCLAVSAAAVEFKQSISDLERMLESRAQQRVERFLGEGARAVVSVRIKEKVQSLSPPVAPGQSEMTAVYGDFVAKVNGLQSNLDQKALNIDSLAIDLQVGEEYDSATAQSAKSLVENLFRELNPRVNLGRLALPKKNPPPPVEPAKAAPVEDPFSVKNLLPLMGPLGAGALLFLGLAILGLFLRGTGHAVVEGFKQVFTLNHLNAGGIGGGASEKQLNPNVKISKAGSDAPALPAALKNYQRNVQLIRQVIQAAPMTLVRVLGDDENDWRGMRWLLPSLSDEEQAVLRKCLGETKLSLLVNADGGKDPAPVFSLWLDELAQRLSVKKVQGGSSVEKALGIERMTVLSAIKPERLSEYAKQASDPAVYRVVIDLISGGARDQLVAAAGPGVWRTLISAADLDEKMLQAAADQLIGALSGTGEEDKKQSAKLEYYSRTLIEMVIGALMALESSQEDSFLEQLEQDDPALASLVREKYWTPSMITRIPLDYLGRIFKGLSRERQLSLLLAVPESGQAILQGLLPPGNAQIILLDQLQRARKNSNPTELKAAVSVLRQFMDHLRKQHQEKQFELQSEAASVVPILRDRAA